MSSLKILRIHNWHDILEQETATLIFLFRTDTTVTVETNSALMANEATGSVGKLAPETKSRNAEATGELKFTSIDDRVGNIIENNDIVCYRKCYMI